MDELLESIDTQSRYEAASYESLVYLMKELTILKIYNKPISALRTASDVGPYEVHTSYAQLPESLL